MRSPLGAYAETVAALIAIVTIAAAIASRPFGFQDAFLDSLAALALGAVFGSTATANGVKSGQLAVESKLDTAVAKVTAVERAVGHDLAAGQGAISSKVDDVHAAVANVADRLRP